MAGHLLFVFGSMWMMRRVIETERLVLRPLEAGDAAAIAALAGDIDVSRMTSRIPHPLTAEEAGRWIAALAGAAEVVFAVLHEGELVGCTGCAPLSERRAEIGYWIGKPWWGRGFATEAVRALVAQAFAAGDYDELASGHFADNPASARVLEKAGFRYTHDERRMCVARGREVLSREYVLARGEARR